MSLVALKGRVVTDYEVWDEGCVLLGDGAVREVGRDASVAEAADEVHELGDALILPGFVDLQVNGAFGVDVADRPELLGELSRRLVSTGTTAYLPTVITSSPQTYERVLPEISAGMAGPFGARSLGVHLEGPFISPGRRGAHPAEHVRPPDAGFLGWLLELAPVRMMTAAPELEGADGLMAAARDRGVVVSLGHSDAPFEVAYAALDRYAAGVTHLFNAMSPLHHRDPGLPGAGFAHPRAVCGLIADGRHVHPEMVALAFRMLGPDRLCLVTDAISAAGMDAGDFTLAGRRVRLEGGVPRLDDGTIAGSVLTMERAFQNILAFTGCTIPEAARMAAATPARLVGEGRRKGRLSPGYDADVTVLAPDLSVEAVWVGGRQLYSAGKVV
ncbi:N-acetylglucosamine-6-phosphate deacetylase [Rubrobacter xylanophilus]|uniref:N-acetylglucosamine-6-phosphate deacetylase n=1 Tax=Rubrobacter xylanophilus TaxID=49319 RepID=A0A510HQ50_9ACTN|nr:N-acetylglucosamine-6-phosphate deacetylase [Rubrobacter xylanophilus]BBL81153.1 N-acetylglucosamine-6-phosphate deacetylase [Rubrobacter xylanophilus]